MQGLPVHVFVKQTSTYCAIITWYWLEMTMTTMERSSLLFQLPALNSVFGAKSNMCKCKMCFVAHQGNPISIQCSAQLKDNISLRFDIMVVTLRHCYTPLLAHPTSLQGCVWQTSWRELAQALCSSPLQFWKRLRPATRPNQMHTTEKTTLFRPPRSPTLPLSLPTGAMELIRTPEAAHSIARLFVKLSTAALAAPVWLSRRGHDLFF